ncbi:MULTISPECIES: cytochrome C oxidase subunit IV family protein [Leptospira]|uniref:Caa(3)-type oxidase, subunit IV n=5 Tax=Leptospira borgpetersenii TaxID=174 RepID=M3HNK5_LEPBO|nr:MULTISPECIES: cytochrome C oxidase subunit IV family protein [Leptospira]EMF99239.1 caa(3)-type oxidase, subunit IV [Leptospira borgpetersenii str. 200701203]EMO11525.1 caa(3)-type oxidase, subunit IV [Leptospira borgpetersenii str. Noumea 25]ALO24651.1 caa(3)-type oxidase, subunit IV [Leptospira borgpetersenii serovar Ballum]ANG99773.1 Caa(3)-type oxidase, subunit IV [Leptospira borgpetersenii str. 4E]AXX14391.1 cytochrome C oxidase subunit IV [Leptospira borgpetersenii serovar Ceylonica]
MELFLNYALYIIVSIGFLIPFTGFVIGAGAIVNATLAGFAINFLSQVLEENKLQDFITRNKDNKFGKALQDAILKGQEKLKGTPPLVEESHGSHHVISVKTYSIIFATLIFFTFVTVWVAGIDFGAMNVIIAMAVATAKASLVLGYFMHLKYDTIMNRVIFGSGFFFLLLLFGFSAADIFTRFKVLLSFAF